MLNRLQAGFSGSDGGLSGIANAPGQFIGVQTPGAQATSLTSQALSGSLPDNTGGALYYVSAVPGSSYGGIAGATGPATAGIIGGGNKIGGNYFSDNWGAPSASFNQSFAAAQAGGTEPSFAAAQAGGTEPSFAQSATGASYGPDTSLAAGTSSGSFNTTGLNTTAPSGGGMGLGTDQSPGFMGGGDVGATGGASSQTIGNIPMSDTVSKDVGSVSAGTASVNGIWEYTGAQATSQGDTAIAKSTATAGEAQAKATGNAAESQNKTAAADTGSLTTTLSNLGSSLSGNMMNLFTRGGVVALGAIFVFGGILLMRYNGAGASGFMKA
jgi:hypothetical protein